MSEPIRSLQVVSVLKAGGMENYIMNLYREMDREKVQFDFLVHPKDLGLFEEEVKSVGGHVYHMTVLDDKNILKYKKDLKKFFSEHPYQIVHGHLSSLAKWYFKAAKDAGVEHRICHSHGAGYLRTLKGHMKHIMFQSADRYATERFACSTEAGQYLYGDKPFQWKPNGIDPTRFNYSDEYRENIRKDLNIDENTFVFGHVGRFNLQKNHAFLLKSFAKADPKESVLLLLGDGETMGSIKQLVKELGVEDKVIFAGVHKDVERYYSAMDAFVLPSLFEGLPVTGIEAQYAGLPCYFSKEITPEVRITEKAHFLPLEEDVWADVYKEAKGGLPQNRTPELLTDIYNIKSAAKDMQKTYLSLAERN